MYYEDNVPKIDRERPSLNASNENCRVVLGFIAMKPFFKREKNSIRMVVVDSKDSEREINWRESIGYIFIDFGYVCDYDKVVEECKKQGGIEDKRTHYYVCEKERNGEEADEKEIIMDILLKSRDIMKYKWECFRIRIKDKDFEDSWFDEDERELYTKIAEEAYCAYKHYDNVIQLLEGDKREIFTELEYNVEYGF